MRRHIKNETKETFPLQKSGWISRRVEPTITNWGFPPPKVEAARRGENTANVKYTIRPAGNSQMIPFLSVYDLQESVGNSRCWFFHIWQAVCRKRRRNGIQETLGGDFCDTEIFIFFLGFGTPVFFCTGRRHAVNHPQTVPRRKTTKRYMRWHCVC